MTSHSLSVASHVASSALPLAAAWPDAPHRGSALNPPAPAPSLTHHEHIGFELGWDYAHHHLCPPAPYAQDPSPLFTGLLAGQAAFGARTLQPTRFVRKWLQLRLHAWLRGRSVELLQVTPHYLQQLDVSHCPIRRVALSAAAADGSHVDGFTGASGASGVTGGVDASVDRVRNDAGYAAGNLAVMSTQANHAKAAYGFRDALKFARELEAGKGSGKEAGKHAAVGGIHGLTAAQWSRVAVLCSLVEPLSHDEACGLPMLLLPPNRLHLLNPAQALQAFVSQQLLKPGWSQRVSRMEALLPGKASRRAFRDFFHALLPRVLEAGRTQEAHRARWAIEDAWRNPLVLARWSAFARQLSAAQCEALVVRASARQLGALSAHQHTEAQATEGWNLASRGYVPHGVLMERSDRSDRSDASGRWESADRSDGASRSEGANRATSAEQADRSARQPQPVQALLPL